LPRKNEAAESGGPTLPLRAGEGEADAVATADDGDKGSGTNGAAVSAVSPVTSTPSTSASAVLVTEDEDEGEGEGIDGTKSPSGLKVPAAGLDNGGAAAALSAKGRRDDSREERRGVPSEDRATTASAGTEVSGEGSSEVRRGDTAGIGSNGALSSEAGSLLRTLLGGGDGSEMMAFAAVAAASTSLPTGDAERTCNKLRPVSASAGAGSDWKFVWAANGAAAAADVGMAEGGTEDERETGEACPSRALPVAMAVTGLMDGGGDGVVEDD